MALLNDVFDDLSLFYENDTTVIFKGKTRPEGRPVILKSHKNPDELYRIKHEFDLLSGKEIPGVTGVLDISYNDDKNYLVMQDTGAVVLDQFIAQQELDTATFLKIAQNAAKSLASIHASDIVHCDIKPANMLIHPDTLEVWFIDFGISFAKHGFEGRNEGFAGTLEFMAPEQTGRLNMVVDERSDLYSLGITFYSILTGTLPFTGETAMEIIHAQTVLPPPPMTEFTSVDPVVEALVMKLMEKAPKKRYRSAASLGHDLLVCQQNLRGDGLIEPFMLGERDVLASLDPGQKLIGKEKQMQELCSAFHATPKDRSTLLLLHGPEGVGKKSLLAAFSDYVRANNGYLLHGSFDWKQNPESYSAIRQIFEGFELFAYSQNLPLPEYRTRILEALGENAQVLIDILPSFESILGPQPPVLKLTPLEAAERAKQVFRKAFEILCDAPFPYVFVFDNVQWADELSIDLLLTALEGKSVGNCVMVLSYQDSDPVFLQHLSGRVERLDKETLTVTDVAIGHMSREDVAGLVEQVFDQDTMQSRELAEVLYDLTGGVIGQIRTYLKLMYHEGKICYDADTEVWTIHVEDLDKQLLKGLEDRYKQEFDTLSDEQRDHISKLACFGEDFQLGEAAYVYGIDEAKLAGTVELIGDKGWLVAQGAEPGRYAFASKPVYELCYDALSREEKDKNHLLVVNRLYERLHKDKDAMLAHSTLFTRQVLLSDRGLFDDEVMHDISRYKLTAAEEFMAAANMAQAARTFANGLRLLGKTPFETDYELAYELHLNYAMCCFAIHDDAKAVELFEIVLTSARGEDDVYGAYFKIVDHYLSTAKWEEAKLYVKRYLRGAGLVLGDEVDVLEAGDKEYLRFLDLTGEDGILVCLNYPLTGDTLVEHHGNMLIMLAEALYFNLDDKCKYYLYKAINFAVENRVIFSEFVRAFCVGAARYASIKHFKKAKWLIESGLEYAEKNKTGQAFLWGVYGNMISHWVNPLSETPEIYKKAKYHALMEGNAFYEAFADMMLLNYHSFIGENLEEFHHETQATLHNLERSQLTALSANFTTFRQYARCLMGRTAAPNSFDDAQFTESSLEEIRGTWDGIFNDNFFFVYRLRSLYIHLYFEEAVEYAEKYLELTKQYNMSAYITHVQFWYYYSMSLLELCRMDPDKREEYVERIKENQLELEQYARLNPLNFEFKYRLVEAGLKGVYNENIELIEEYSQCHKGFEAKGLIWDAIFVERLVGNFWVKREIPQYVAIHKKRRLDYYKRIGARYCMRLLADVDEEPVHRKHSSLSMAGTMGTMGTMHTTHWGSSFMRSTRGSHAQYSGVNAALDFGALLEVLEKLIQLDTLSGLSGEFMALLMQNGNAEKALLFLEDGSLVNLAAAKYAIDAEGDFNDTELPLEMDVIEDDVVPKKLVELVRTKGEMIVANSARGEHRMLGDIYLNTHAPESFLCMPVAVEGKQLGVVYLENATLPGSFPEGRIRFLGALVTQTAALIQNLQNVARMADYTKDLERRLSSYLGQQNALIAGIAHEINSPVGVCLTVATKIYEKTQQILAAFEEKKLGMKALYKYLEETRDGLNIINNNVMRAGDLVQNFKKMSVEQSTEVFENLELEPTLKNIVEYIRPGVKKKIDHIDIDVPKDLYIYSSSGVLAQVFTNLIMNSAIHGFEHKDKEGCVASIKVTDLPSRDEIEIRYQDNGKGMTPEEKEKVFQPFFTTKRNRGGSGLGGHIILTNVTQTLQGSVQCESALGEGTTFIITLPKHKKEAKEG